MKKPSKNQISKWTIPSKASYYGFLLTIISLIIAFLSISVTFSEIGTNQYAKFSVTTTKKKLELHQENEEWQSMGVLLGKVDKTYHGQGWYNYYSGVLSLYSNSAISNLRSPEYYFSKIKPEDKFFDKSVIFQLADILKTKNSLLFTDKIMKLRTRLENLGYTNPEYYLTFLFSCHLIDDKSELIKKYMLMKENYYETFTNVAGQITYNVKEVGVPIPTDIGKLSKIYAVSFIYAYEMYKNDSLSQEVIHDLKTMFPNQDAFTFAIMGMSNLNVEMDSNKKAEFRGFIRAINNFQS